MTVLTLVRKARFILLQLCYECYNYVTDMNLLALCRKVTKSLQTLVTIDVPPQIDSGRLSEGRVYSGKGLYKPTLEANLEKCE